MQYLTMTRDMTLKQLSDIVGDRNLDTVLNTNNMERSYNIGAQFYAKIEEVSKTDAIDYQKKLSILNQFVGDSDLYEKAALGTENDWKALASFSCFTNAIKISNSVTIPSSVGVLGNGEPVPKNIYKECSESLKKNHEIKPEIFAEYNASYYDGARIGRSATNTGFKTYQWFKFPKDIALYSALADEMIYFPVYPEGFSDGVTANYDDMPEMLYQYEPWKVYKSSGPREIKFTFKFHRDMWTGDHRDGKANEVIRKCQANCYPQYNGSLVNYSLVAMYMHNDNLITGVMTDCDVSWDGPIGLDGFYLECELSFTIVEVSPQPLNYDSVRSKKLIQ